MQAGAVRVALVMGSDSDLDTLRAAEDLLVNELAPPPRSSRHVARVACEPATTIRY